MAAAARSGCDAGVVARCRGNGCVTDALAAQDRMAEQRIRLLYQHRNQPAWSRQDQPIIASGSAVPGMARRPPGPDVLAGAAPCQAPP
jgi:hypothetical protein